MVFNLFRVLLVFSKGTREASRVHSNPKEVGKGPHQKQYGGCSLAAGADGGTGVSLGGRVQTVSQQARPA